MNTQKVADALRRFRHCNERANKAYARMMRHPATATGNQQMESSNRWDAKAQAAWEEAFSLLCEDPTWEG